VLRGEGRHPFVVLGGEVAGQAGAENTASVEILRFDSETEENIFTTLPPLSCGPICRAVALAVDESESEQGQVLLVGARCDDEEYPLAVYVVDLATGMCTTQPFLLPPEDGRMEGYTAARLPDGRIICIGVDYDLDGDHMMAQALEPVEDDSLNEASWRWRALPKGNSVNESDGAHGYRQNGFTGCVLNDGRFAVFGGMELYYAMPDSQSSCDALTLDGVVEH